MDQSVAKDLEAWVRDFESRLASGSAPSARCRGVIKTTAQEVAAWYERNGEGRGSLAGFLDRAERFVEELDQALHLDDGPFAKNKYCLWRHLSARDVSELKPAERQQMVDRDQLRQLATEYLRAEYLHNSYLDLVFVDSMTLAEMLGTVEWHLSRTLGIGYALFGSNPLMIFLWKLITVPLGFAINWVVPGYLCYLFFERAPKITIGIAAIYYGWMLLVFMLVLWGRIARLFSRMPSENERMSKLIREMVDVYSLLGGPVIHIATLQKAFERSSLDGVGWDQQTFYILDRLAKAEQPVLAPAVV